jgi:hypothetical protein
MIGMTLNQVKEIRIFFRTNKKIIEVNINPYENLNDIKEKLGLSDKILFFNKKKLNLNYILADYNICKDDTILAF